MNAMTKINPAPNTDRALGDILARQRAAFLRDGTPSLAAGRRDLMKLKNGLLARKEEFVVALDADFGHRARQETLMLDIGSVIETTKYLHSNLRRFMRPERRSTAMVFFPGSNRVVYQPLGVVGIVAPWNYPVSLALAPLATAIARWQSRHAEAIRVHTGDDGAPRRNAGRTLRRGSGCRGDRRCQSRCRIHQAQVRSYPLHGQHPGRLCRDACGK